VNKLSQSAATVHKHWTHNSHHRYKYSHCYGCCMCTGEYPVMRPGASFTWISSTHFPTTYGNMRGHFTMINLQTGQCIT